MSFSIDTFRSGALNAGGARANLFDVTMTGPTAAGLTISEMNYSCKGASIPPMTVGVVEVLILVE